MLWRKNLNRRSRVGSFDFARMSDGNGAIRLFLSVTEIPRRTEGDNIDDYSDRLTLLGIVDRWPIGAVLDCRKSQGEVRFIETASQLHRLLDDRVARPCVSRN
jgi:hypothetical protein